MRILIPRLWLSQRLLLCVVAIFLLPLRSLATTTHGGSTVVVGDATATSNSSNNVHDNEKDAVDVNSDSFVCSLYLAPSLIIASATGASDSSTSSGSRGSNSVSNTQSSPSSSSLSTSWGTYTAVDIADGEPIHHPQLAIPLYDFREHSRLRKQQQEQENRQLQQQVPGEFSSDSFAFTHTDSEELSHFVIQFMWTGETAGFAATTHRDASEVDRMNAVAVAVPGLGLSAQYSTSMTKPYGTYNAQWDVVAAFHDNYRGDRNYHYGRDDSSVHTATLRATQTIIAGQEIMVLFDNGEYDGEDPLLLTDEDYHKLDQFIALMMTFFDKHNATLNHDESALQHIYDFLLHDFMEAAVGPDKAQLIANVMPHSPAHLHRIAHMEGGIKAYSSTHTSHSPNSPEDEEWSLQRVQWLQQHGYCLSHVQPASSTLPQAGLGAFATHTIAQGTVIAPVPLLHITDARVLDMFDLSLLLDKSRLGQQVLMNYVLGHPNSSMVFLPTTSAVTFMNHADQPNAKLQWAKTRRHENHHHHHHVNNEHWWNVSPDSMSVADFDKVTAAYYDRIHLLMEVVALREIKPGEEIFLDYGPEWKHAWEAWENANANFVDANTDTDADADAGAGPAPLLRAADFNRMYQTRVLPTVEEIDAMQFTDYAVTLKAFIRFHPYQPQQEEEEVIMDMEDGAVLESGAGLLYAYEESPFTKHGFSTFYSVEIDARFVASKHSNKEGDDTVATDSDSDEDKVGVDLSTVQYTVRLEHNDEIYYVNGVPHSAFVFVDNPSPLPPPPVTTETLTVQPFRHYIGIPDEIFPQGVWRNRV